MLPYAQLGSVMFGSELIEIKNCSTVLYLLFRLIGSWLRHFSEVKFVALECEAM
jgi:hypothetical protein